MKRPAPEIFQYLPKTDSGFLRHTEFGRSATHRNRLNGILALLRHCAQREKDSSILEIGCGVGNIAIPLGSLGYRIMAIDIHARSIEIARQRNSFPNVEFAHRPFEEVNLREFDVIILTEVLEHVSAYEHMVSKIASGMKEGSGLILTVPNGWCISEVCCRPSYFLKRYSWGPALVKRIKKGLKTRDLTTANEQTPHVHFFTLGALHRLFRRHSLRVERFQRYFLFWPLLETFFSERLDRDDWARKDFEWSQSAPASLCAVWAFLLRKSSPTNEKSKVERQ